MRLLPPSHMKHKGAVAVGVVALILFVVAAVYGDHGLVHLLRMQAEQRELERKVFELQQRNEHLRQQIRRLESDDWYLEKLAREQLGLVKKGEIIYRSAPTPAAVPSH